MDYKNIDVRDLSLKSKLVYHGQRVSFFVPRLLNKLSEKLIFNPITKAYSGADYQEVKEAAVNVANQYQNNLADEMQPVIDNYKKTIDDFRNDEEYYETNLAKFKALETNLEYLEKKQKKLRTAPKRLLIAKAYFNAMKAFRDRKLKKKEENNQLNGIVNQYLQYKLDLEDLNTKINNYTLEYNNKVADMKEFMANNKSVLANLNLPTISFTEPSKLMQANTVLANLDNNAPTFENDGAPSKENLQSLNPTEAQTINTAIPNTQPVKDANLATQASPSAFTNITSFETSQNANTVMPNAQPVKDANLATQASPSAFTDITSFKTSQDVNTAIPNTPVEGSTENNAYPMGGDNYNPYSNDFLGPLYSNNNGQYNIPSPYPQQFSESISQNPAQANQNANVPKTTFEPNIGVVGNTQPVENVQPSTIPDPTYNQPQMQVPNSNLQQAATTQAPIPEMVPQQNDFYTQLYNALDVKPVNSTNETLQSYGLGNGGTKTM